MSYKDGNARSDYESYIPVLKGLGKPKAWISENNSKILIAKVCDPLGKTLSRDVKTSQIRKFLNEVQALAITPRVEKIPLIKAKLAYAAGRNYNLKGFYDVMAYAMDEVADVEDIVGFRELLLGTVAYHKYYGGKE
ncbi:MAG: type III-A CRISPR-associated protein Csm2 [Candidatus Methanofastidiosa archaeon]|nr:type III-A CRISPR-associated protein Csm2 [Candidatus Methanofastidiosa archaeon]